MYIYMLPAVVSRHEFGYSPNDTVTSARVVHRLIRDNRQTIYIYMYMYVYVCMYIYIFYCTCCGVTA